MRNKKNNYLCKQLIGMTIASLANLIEIKASDFRDFEKNQFTSNLSNISTNKNLNAFFNSEIPITKLNNKLIVDDSISNNKKHPYFQNKNEETKNLKSNLSETQFHDINELLTKKVVLNSLTGASSWFLSANMRTFDVRMHAYVHPERSFTQFDERHWHLISMGIHNEKPIYRLQYVLAPGFSKQLHSLACVEPRKGNIHLGLIAHDVDPHDQDNIEWFIDGDNKKGGITLKNRKYNLYLKGSSGNKISLTSNETEHGVKWRIAITNDYSKAIIALKKENRDTSSFCNDLFCRFSHSIIKLKSKDSQYISVDVSINKLEFSKTIEHSIRNPILPVGWQSITNADSTLMFVNTTASSIKEKLVLTAMPVQQEDGSYPTIGLYTANKSNQLGQFWVVIPAESGSDNYYIYLRDSINNDLPLVLSLFHNKLIISPQDIIRQKLIKVSNKNFPFIMSIFAVKASRPEYVDLLNKILSSMFFPGYGPMGGSNRTVSAAAYNTISGSNQIDIINNSGVFSNTGLLATRKAGLDKIAYGAALSVASYAQKWNLQQWQNNPTNVAVAAPMCTIAWYSTNTPGTSYKPYILMTNSKDETRAYNPINIQYPVTPEYSSVATKPTNVLSFPTTGTWNPTFA